MIYSIQLCTAQKQKGKTKKETLGRGTEEDPSLQTDRSTISVMCT